MRSTSNDYPADHIEMFEHNSLVYPGSQEEVWGRLEAQIADLLASTGADQVNLLGHSQGTGLVQGYLNSDPNRAIDVARYVNLDVVPAAPCPTMSRPWPSPSPASGSWRAGQ